MSATKKDEVIILKEKAARLAAEQERLETATVDILQFSTPQNDREREVMKLMAQRMTLTEKLENVLGQINAHERNDIQLSKAELNSLKEKKKGLFEQLNALPPTGATQAEWDAMPDNFKKKSVGRPTVSLEQKIIRTRNDFEATMAKIAELAGSVDYDEIMSMSNDENVIEKRNGRPKHDALGNLDTQLKNVRSKIAYITSGELERHVAERLKNSMYSNTGKRLGRSFEDPSAKLERLQGEESQILTAIANMESKLTGADRDMRSLKTLRDRRNAINKQLEGEVSQEMSNALYAELDTVIEELSVVEAKVRSHRSQANEKLSSPVAKKYAPTDTQNVAQKPITLTRSVRTENRSIDNSANLAAQPAPDLAVYHSKAEEDTATSRVLGAIRATDDAIRLTEETRESVGRLMSRKKS
jgi:hypothetical protein